MLKSHFLILADFRVSDPAYLNIYKQKLTARRNRNPETQVSGDVTGASFQEAFLEKLDLYLINYRYHIKLDLIAAPIEWSNENKTKIFMAIYMTLVQCF